MDLCCENVPKIKHIYPYEIWADLWFLKTDMYSDILKLRREFLDGAFCILLSRPFDKIDMTLGQCQWPRVTRRTGPNQCALLLEKSVDLSITDVIRSLSQRREKSGTCLQCVWQRPGLRLKLLLMFQPNSSNTCSPHNPSQVLFQNMCHTHGWPQHLSLILENILVLLHDYH